MKIKSFLVGGLLLAGILSGCGHKATPENKAQASDSLAVITQKAKKEGQVLSVGMPDDWADWKDTWQGLDKTYGIKHEDTDMSSSEELAKFESEGKNGTVDIGDIGISFAPYAVEKDLLLPYKTSYWDEIPTWAKDDSGKWLVSYTGSVAFMIDTQSTKEVPTSWAELAKGKAKVAVGDVTKGYQNQVAVLAATYAQGGNESDITKGLSYFKKLAEAGRLSTVDPSLDNLEKGEVDVAVLWDFNALNYRDKLDHDRYKVVIPSDGSVTSGYTTAINKNAPHPNSAKLAREYILSDQGQINLAKGYARPVRSKVKLPDDVAAKLLPESEYKNAKPIADPKAWDETAKQLPELWESEVMSYAK